MNEKTSNTPAKSARHRARELALQGIYQWRMAGTGVTQIEKATRDEKSLGRYDVDFFSQLLRGAVNQQETLAAHITPHLDRKLDELSPIEFSVLLLGAFELANLPEIPYRVVINESVELAKTFGGSDGHKFVNGVLDKMAAQLRATEVNAKN